MIHESFECQIYFIRHGESQSNATPGYIAGVNLDSSLTDRGKTQATMLGNRLRQESVTFDLVYSSSMSRAVQTTEIMLASMGQEGRKFSEVDEIIEQQVHGWRGVRSSDVMSSEMISYMRTKGSHFVPPDGESFSMVQRRMSGWLEDEIIYNEPLVSTNSSVTIAIVGHGISGKCLFHYIMGFDDRFIEKLELNNCSISRFVFSREGWRVVCLNDSYHMK